MRWWTHPKHSLTVLAKAKFEWEDFRTRAWLVRWQHWWHTKKDLLTCNYLFACCGAFLWPLWTPLSITFSSYVSVRSDIITMPYCNLFSQNNICEILLIIIYLSIFVSILVAGICFTVIWWLLILMFVSLVKLFKIQLFVSVLNLCRILNFICNKYGRNETDK